MLLYSDPSRAETLEKLTTERTKIRGALLALRKQPHKDHTVVRAELREKMVQIEQRITEVLIPTCTILADNR